MGERVEEEGQGMGEGRGLPLGAQSATTPGRKESCLLIRLGGEGPFLIGAPSSISSTRRRNSCTAAIGNFFRLFLCCERILFAPQVR